MITELQTNNFYHCAMLYLNLYIVHSPTVALFIKLGEV